AGCGDRCRSGRARCAGRCCGCSCVSFGDLTFRDTPGGITGAEVALDFEKVCSVHPCSVYRGEYSTIMGVPSSKAHGCGSGAARDHVPTVPSPTPLRPGPGTTSPILPR